MILQGSDLLIIAEALKDYQWWVENFPNFYFDSMAIGPLRRVPEVQRFHSRRAKIEYQGPLIARVLAGDIPDGFNLLSTVDRQWYAWRPGSNEGLQGPTTEFQARLWCLKEANLKEEWT